MNKFENALGQKFAENKDLLRIRTFEFNGVTFKIKVPLTAESDLMFERNKIADEALVQQYYADMAKEFINNKEKYSTDEDIVYSNNDIVVKGISLQETAKNKVISQNRILDLFKLIVPEDASFDMNTITYADIEENFPFNVQLEIIDKISKVISPSYTQNKGK